MSARKGKIRLQMEAMDIGQVHTHVADISSFWRIRSTANTVRRATGRRFVVTWYRDAKEVTVERIEDEVPA